MAEPHALIPKCVECGESWLPPDTERWRAFWIDDGLEDVLLFYCAKCAQPRVRQHDPTRLGGG